MNFRLLRNRSFFFLWLAQIGATLGNELYNVGVMVIIYERTGSALQATGVLLARTLPPFLFSPLAGALVDRYNRQQVLVVMNLARVASIATVFFLNTDVAPSVWLIYCVVFGLSLADAFYKPAQMALIPTIAPRGLLMRANSLIMSTNLGAFALAYGAGPWLLIQFGARTLVVTDLICFLLAALCATQIVTSGGLLAGSKEATTTPLLRMVADGLRYVRGHDLARALVTMEMLEHWPHGIWTASIMLAFAERALHASPEAWGYQNALWWGGNMLGAAVAMALASRLAQRPGWIIILNAFINSLLTLGYGLSPGLGFTLFLCLVYGLPSAIRDVSQDTLLQSSVDAHMLGRVYATRQMLLNICLMVASVLFAWMADQAPVRWVFVIGATLYFGTALYAFSQKALRQAQMADQPAQDPVAA